jgi:hypothetical protein
MQNTDEYSFEVIGSGSDDDYEYGSTSDFTLTSEDSESPTEGMTRDLADGESNSDSEDLSESLQTHEEGSDNDEESTHPKEEGSDEYEVEDEEWKTTEEARKLWKRVDEKIAQTLADDILRLVTNGVNVDLMIYPNPREGSSEAVYYRDVKAGVLWSDLFDERYNLGERTGIPLDAIVLFPRWRLNNIQDHILDEVWTRGWDIRSVTVEYAEYEKDNRYYRQLQMRWDVRLPES